MSSGLQKPWLELPPVNKPLDKISMDITDMGNGAHGYRYVLTTVDHFSRFVKFYSLRTRNTEEVVRNVQDYLCDFGVQSQYEVMSPLSECFVREHLKVTEVM